MGETGTGKGKRRCGCTKGGNTRKLAEGEVKGTGQRPPHYPSSNGEQQIGATWGGGEQTLEPTDREGEREDVSGYTTTP